MRLFTDEEVKQLDKLYLQVVQFYHEKVKEIVIASERLDDEQRVSIAAINEFRSAHEHIMRAHGMMNGILQTKTAEELGVTPYQYCFNNLEKAKGHLYRAAYDAYDIIGMRMIEEIDHLVDDISATALYTVIPDATEKIINPYHNALDRITEGKIKKDVRGDDYEEKQFSLYEEAIDQLTDVRQILFDNGRGLTDCAKELKSANLINRLSLWVGIGGILLAVIMGYIKFFG